MRALAIIDAMAKNSGIKPSRLAINAGLSANYVSSTKARDAEPTAAVLARLCAAGGYELCAVPREDVPDSALIVDAAPPNTKK